MKLKFDFFVVAIFAENLEGAFVDYALDIKVFCNAIF